MSDAASILYGSSTPTASPTPAAPAVNGDAATTLYGNPQPAQAPAQAAKPVPRSAPTAQAKPNTQQAAPSATDAGNWDPNAPLQTQAEWDTAQAEANKPMTPEQQLEALDGAVPDTVREMRGAPERKLFSAQVEHATTITEADVAAVHPNLSPEVQSAIAHEAREIWADMGFSAAEAKDVIAAAKRFDTTQPAEKLWEQTAKALKDALGMQAKAGYEAAIQLANRDERTAKALAMTGQGNNPAVVLALAKSALRLRGQGRL